MYISDGKVHEVNVLRRLKIPPGSVIVVDRGCVDYELFRRWDEGGVVCDEAEGQCGVSCSRESSCA